MRTTVGATRPTTRGRWSSYLYTGTAWVSGRHAGLSRPPGRTWPSGEKELQAESDEQAYNAQVVVDEESQVIIASSVTQEANDKAQLVPMLRLAAGNVGHVPGVILADAGYFSGRAVTDEVFSHSDLYVSPDRWKHGQEPPLAMGPPPLEASVAARMRYELRTHEGREVYKRRKTIEAVFRQIKEARA